VNKDVVLICGKSLVLSSFPYRIVTHQRTLRPPTLLLGVDDKELGTCTEPKEATVLTIWN
jgi:hypothetical protein